MVVSGFRSHQRHHLNAAIKRSGNPNFVQAAGANISTQAIKILMLVTLLYSTRFDAGQQDITVQDNIIATGDGTLTLTANSDIF